MKYDIDCDKYKKEIKKLKQLDRIEFKQKLTYHFSLLSSNNSRLGTTVLLAMGFFIASVIFYSFSFFIFSDEFTILFLITYVSSLLVGLMGLVLCNRIDKVILKYIDEHYEEYFDMNKIIKDDN